MKVADIPEDQIVKPKKPEPKQKPQKELPLRIENRT